MLDGATQITGRRTNNLSPGRQRNNAAANVDLVDTAVTQVEGETRVALATCEALEGDAQNACSDYANAHLDAVKAKAKAKAAKTD